MQGARYRSCWN